MKNYFSHDSDARNSKKMLRLRKALGAEGYGTYFMLIERLREEDGYTCEADYEMLAYDLRVDPSIIKSVVEDFGLFVMTENGTFYSAGLTDRMDSAFSTTKSDAGKKGAEARWKNKKSNTNENSMGVLEFSEENDVRKSENPSRMAPNGTIMADTNSAIWQNDGKNGNKTKLNKTKQDNNISLSLTPSLTVGETDTDILNIFFFEKGYRNASEEVKRFTNFYISNGQMAKMTPEQLAAKARIWEPRGQKDYIHPRFSEGFLSFWRKIYYNMLSSGVSASLLNAMRGDDIKEGTRDSDGKTYCLTLPQAMIDYIEDNKSVWGIFREYLTSIGLKDLRYELLKD